MNRYIDADALKKALVKPINDFVDGVSSSLEIGKIIDEQPSFYFVQSADVREVVHGEWIPRQDLIQGEIYDGYRCSICGIWKSVLEKYNYCPNCGAKMENKK